MEIIIAISIGIGVLLILLFVFLALITRFYVKAPADRAFLKTGSGKPKVIFNGGEWVFPALHKISWVDCARWISTSSVQRPTRC
ncbi:hypothetical protein HC891_25595 [Candidatus Gracilibacteria bacterium]|nr:hypothetical protein [Candidatus Gracilibacteria bacterium]